MAAAGVPGDRKGILERLDSGEVVIGDGSFLITLEKRGYVKAGRWTPEAVVEHPNAVRQLHMEFLRAGSNVMQTFTFSASEDNMESKYFEHAEEAVWAVEVLKEAGKPVAATMCIGPEGDMHDVPPGECAVKLVKAGASIVGVNCRFGPSTSLRTMKLMKEGLQAAGLKAHLIVQSLGFHTPDCGKGGFLDLPEYPFALEPRVATRWDIQKYAREAYNLGIRYIGGCCGFEPYHIRAIAEELAPERGFLPPASEKHGSWGSGLDMHTKPWIRARARREHWENLLPASGRPFCPSLSKPDA
ncbi:S-methylmethionine--homocysteine S-methyltransferase BHMT2 isoform X2 [Trichechus manatus latirostris]|uniref:S-methylmethionine--homocysteine S-methyltransferase BHMT2 isoform X2 n=1 Tax=Trichechus manatus latirostris TaxID=127582 RepID=A0A2Y9R0N6_TRIMA|nr:S-methylmethionine--homocysteine S-methyltransferase BHMT2 isoform X2 [Trichechus manatus latirostris]